jgi:hypothetical protein
MKRSQKARRGELFRSVAIGYVRSNPDRIEKDPDLRVREALALVFRKFAEMQSVRQVHLWLRQERIALPAVDHRRKAKGLTTPLWLQRCRMLPSRGCPFELPE